MLPPGAPGKKLFPGESCALRGGGICMGLLCCFSHGEKTAYSYAGVTLAIIVLIPRSSAAWIVAFHRFFEVSAGILVALALVAVWRTQPRIRKKRFNNLRVMLEENSKNELVRDLFQPIGLRADGSLSNSWSFTRSPPGCEKIDDAHCARYRRAQSDAANRCFAIVGCGQQLSIEAETCQVRVRVYPEPG